MISANGFLDRSRLATIVHVISLLLYTKITPSARGKLKKMSLGGIRGEKGFWSPAT